MREESEGDQPAGLFWQIAIPAVPLLVLAAHFVWPSFLPLKLVAIGLVVTLLSIPVQALHAAIVAGNLGGDVSFTLHFGETVFVALVGVLLAIWWGWVGAGAVFCAYLVWSVLAGLACRFA